VSPRDVSPPANAHATNQQLIVTFDGLALIYKSLQAAKALGALSSEDELLEDTIQLVEAAEIAGELIESFEFSPAERLAVQEAARCIAILEAIDRDFDERGLVDDEGTPRYLLNHRSRISRQLERWLQKISAATERNPASKTEPLRADLPEYVRALQGIALGRDATARDRLAALRELLKLERRGTSSYLEASSWDDPELQRRWARVSARAGR